MSSKPDRVYRLRTLALCFGRSGVRPVSDFVSRDFSGRQRMPQELGGRLPPGQYAERGFPVLTAGPTPRIEPHEWGFRIDGLVGRERE